MSNWTDRRNPVPPGGKLESKGTVRRNVEEKVARGSDFAMGPEGTGEGPENTEDQVCDAASPRASPRAGGPAASALPALPGWGGVFSGLGSGAGSPASEPSGRLGDLSGGRAHPLCPTFPSSHSLGVWGRGTAWMRFLFSP